MGFHTVLQVDDPYAGIRIVKFIDHIYPVTGDAHAV